MRRIAMILLGATVPTTSACNAYRLDPPQGFAQVAETKRGARMKAGDDVGLRVDVFDNVEGGTLAFWGEDLVRKLSQRDYALLGHRPLKSDDGKPGTQFDFAYTNPDGGEKFYSVALFVTDEYRVVMQLAGDAELADKYRPRLPRIAAEAKIRGCKITGSICRGEQPSITPLEPEEKARAEQPHEAPHETALADAETES